MTTEAQINKLLEQGEAVYRLLDGDCRITLLSVFVLTRNQAYSMTYTGMNYHDALEIARKLRERDPATVVFVEAI